jgi:hypothetical protein
VAATGSAYIWKLTTEDYFWLNQYALSQDILHFQRSGYEVTRGGAIGAVASWYSGQLVQWPVGTVVQWDYY